MDGRVTPYAEANGLGWYRGTPGPIHKPLEHLWENAPEGSPLQSATKKVMDTIDENFNRAWINAQVNSERNIVDIGVATDSTFYQIERHAVDGYANYRQDFQPNMDLRPILGGGNP
ncbi:transposase and inactivated derivatives [Microbacterium testaceum StLB037]|uniref:Transposase and inactivated derivatives n=1 Tax=Microbacterium testaceum (strain StLB037) TaxID=979556 RepID=E8NAF3_MICTS|nr:hypothetical protein [Microbacterium testaceum]BAJ74609.1 transposase and inactivated derivatives [Microbacterium testaceum StLB037]